MKFPLRLLLTITALARRGDQEAHSDWVHIAIDARNDRRSTFGFSVNPRGIQRAVYGFDDANQDESGEAVWEAAAAIDSLGWTVEYRIPFSQLGFHVAEGVPVVGIPGHARHCP